MSDRQALGANLKNLRQAKKLTLKQVAGLAGCSESMLSKVENGKGNPSLNILHAIASAVGVDIGTLFLPESMTDKVVSRKGERECVQVAGGKSGVSLEYLSPHKADNILQAHIQIVAPAGGSLGAFSHEGEEFGYVLEGVLELTVDGVTYRINEEDSFFFQSSLPHSFRNPGDKPTRVLWANTPPSF
jgi:transcriptional regulator with XRE-family HTH domain